VASRLPPEKPFVTLAIAAAMAFREAQGASPRFLASFPDREDALNIAASALSRLLPVYVIDEATHARVATKVDVANGKFLHGASEFRRSDGTLVTSMSVKRDDLASVLPLIRRVGIPFDLAIGDGSSPLPARTPRPGTPASK
jgi:hypothetical protein